jgi:hypothetical protein
LRYENLRKFAIIGNEKGIIKKFEVYRCNIGGFEGIRVPKRDVKKIIDAALIYNVGSVLCDGEIYGLYNATGEFLAPFFLNERELTIDDRDPIYPALVLDCAAGGDASLITIVTETGYDYSKRAEKIFEETGLAVNITNRASGVFAKDVLREITAGGKILYKGEKLDLKTLDLIFYNFSKPYRNLIRGIYVSAAEIRRDLEKLLGAEL